MYITPVLANNYNNKNIYKQNQLSKPIFQGALDNRQMEKVLNMLAPKNNEVFESFSGQKLKEVMDYLIAKYQCLGIRSIGIQIVDNKDLGKLLGKEITKYDTNGKMGLCVAIGDKFGPIENMTNVYEAKTFLLKDNDLNKLR